MSTTTVVRVAIGDPVRGLLGCDTLRTITAPRSLAAMFAIDLALAWRFLHPIAAVECLPQAV